VYDLYNLANVKFRVFPGEFPISSLSVCGLRNSAPLLLLLLVLERLRKPTFLPTSHFRLQYFSLYMTIMNVVFNTLFLLFQVSIWTSEGVLPSCEFIVSFVRH